MTTRVCPVSVITVSPVRLTLLLKQHTVSLLKQSVNYSIETSIDTGVETNS